MRRRGGDLLCDPGSELRLGGSKKRRAKIVNEMDRKIGGFVAPTLKTQKRLIAYKFSTFAVLTSMSDTWHVIQVPLKLCERPPQRRP